MKKDSASCIKITLHEVSKYGVISGPYFPAFGLNTKSYFVSLGIQSECGKIQNRNNSVFDWTLFRQYQGSIIKKNS